MDLHMPLMNGFQAMGILKKMIENKEISPMRIVACTGAVTQQEVKKAVNAGFDGVLAKPINNEAL